jgi:LDH2 family malate/lactate/ureidoglycolate dehydrogenase
MSNVPSSPTNGSAASPLVLVDATALTAYCAALFTTVGMPHDDAALAAEQLVTADLRGVESHGVVRVPIYVERLRCGVMAAQPVIAIARQTRSTAVLDGGNGMGQVVGERAMSLAVAKAAEHGEPAFVSVRNSNHFGAAAWFVEIAARAQMIGLAYTIGGINHMVPWGGAEAMLGNNPFAVAMPMRNAPPMVLDMACSVAARGKIIVAAKEGRSIPPDWAVDRDGRPTTDARAALEGFVAPVGGPKGYALTLTIGLLSTMLSGAFFGSEVTHMYDDFEHAQNIGHLFGALPIAAFEDLDRYYERMAKAGDDVRGVRRASGVERIHLPGEREAELAARRRAAGLPLGTGTWAELAGVGTALGVPLPTVKPGPSA